MRNVINDILNHQKQIVKQNIVFKQQFKKKAKKVQNLCEYVVQIYAQHSHGHCTNNPSCASLMQKIPTHLPYFR
jgi:hypothetical protein